MLAGMDMSEVPLPKPMTIPEAVQWLRERGVKVSYNMVDRRVKDGTIRLTDTLGIRIVDPRSLRRFLLSGDFNRRGKGRKKQSAELAK